jgi:hypothetical protein
VDLATLTSIPDCDIVDAFHEGRCADFARGIHKKWLRCARMSRDGPIPVLCDCRLMDREGAIRDIERRDSSDVADDHGSIAAIAYAFPRGFPALVAARASGNLQTPEPAPGEVIGRVHAAVSFENDRPARPMAKRMASSPSTVA